MTELPQPCYRFGDVLLDSSNLRLTVSGEVRTLEPKAFRLLQFLIENRQRVVTKDRILAEVWEGVAVSDNALTRAIAQARKALDDDPKQPRYIETVPTVGYRFVAEVNAEVASPVAQPVPRILEPASPGIGPAPPRRRPFAWRSSVMLALAVVLGAIAIAGLVLLRSGQEPSASQPVPFTTFPGREVSPTFSPDGNQVAFTWSGEHDDNLDIYVKSIGSETPLRLTTDPARDTAPQWSPNGRAIAFERAFPGGRVAIMLVPPLGGPERTLVELFSHWNEGGSATGPMGTSWSPDGKWLAVSGDIGSQGSDRTYLVSVETGEVRPLTQPPSNELGDYGPTFSPDGRSMIFDRSPKINGGDIYKLSLGQDLSPLGEPQKLLSNASARQAVWINQGREILLLTFDGAILRIPASGSNSQAPVSLGLGTGLGPLAVSRDGRRLIYSVITRDTNVWRLDLTAPGAAPERWIASTQRDVFPQYSPDGRRIAFYSNRSGSYEIWVSEADGSKAAAITSLKFAGTPRWSPDGRTIAFDSNDTGRYQVYTVSPDGGKLRQLTHGASASFGASWSRDGRWIYFASSAEGDAQVWKIPSQGGAPVQVTHNGGMAATESPDGKILYYNKAVGQGSLWRMPVASGLEEKIANPIYRFNYAVADNGVYLTQGTSINFLDFSTGAIRTVLKTPRPDAGLTISADGRYLLFAQVDAIGSDLMMVDNFH
jgi:Tol biopolymer transport system component/DNA-binding winged helix-turn-helix (wHTH) protein